MKLRVFIIFLGAQLFAVTSTHHAVSGTETSRTKREVEAVQKEFDTKTSVINLLGGRILTTSNRDSQTRESDEKSTSVPCERWYWSTDGRIQCFPATSTSITTNAEPSIRQKQPLHVYLPGLPSFGIPIWSSSPLDRSPIYPSVYGNLRREENDRKPAHGIGGLELKPVILEPAHIAPKPIVVHKPVFVPKPIEIAIHKPVIVHKPIEIYKPAVIHKPIEIPVHKPVFVEKPFAVTVHKPVIVDKPFELKPSGPHHDSLLSQILKEQMGNFHGGQQQLHGIENSGYEELHQTGYVSSHDSGKDAKTQGSAPTLTEDRISPDLFPHFGHVAPPPKSVQEFHGDIGATYRIPQVPDRNANTKTDDDVIKDVIKSITGEDDDLKKTILPDGNDDETRLHETTTAEAEFGGQTETHRSSTENLGDDRIPSDPSPIGTAEMSPETKSIGGETDAESELELEEGPDVIEEAQNGEDEQLSRTIREATGVPFDDILQDKREQGTVIDRTTLLELMTALKDQYLKNAEPDQRKVIEDAFDRLHCSVGTMKQLEERPNWKKTDGSKKAGLELLTERAPVDVDEWDYYSDAADDVSAEPSFLELLNVATKHKGKQAEENR